MDQDIEEEPVKFHNDLSFFKDYKCPKTAKQKSKELVVTKYFTN
jgi:hypothetical protein